MSSQRRFYFHMTNKREAVPPGAAIFAICTHERTLENQDEDLFVAISDEEYYELRKMVREAEQLEIAQHSASAPTFWQNIGKFFYRLSVLFSGKSTNNRGQAGKLSTYRARAVAPMRL